MLSVFRSEGINLLYLSMNLWAVGALSDFRISRATSLGHRYQPPDDLCEAKAWSKRTETPAPR